MKSLELNTERSVKNMTYKRIFEKCNVIFYEIDAYIVENYVFSQFPFDLLLCKK